MVATRLVGRLDIKGPNLVKGIHLEGLRTLGRPDAFASLYYDEGVDELLYMDVVASLFGRNSLPDLISRTAREVFVPLCVGGGLRSIDDVREVLCAGADKVAVNTAVIKRPEFVTELAERFGSSTIVVSIEAVRQPDGSWTCSTDAGRETTGIDAIEWAARASDLGAGELLVTSVDRDGTGRGFDVELLQTISNSVAIPVIASGGAGSPEHLVVAASQGCADAFAVASLLHYEAIQRETLDLGMQDVSATGNVEFRRSGRVSSRLTPAGVRELKKALVAGGVTVRPGRPYE